MRSAYLLGTAAAGRLPGQAVRMAFIGDAGHAALPAPGVHAGTVLCRGIDVDGTACGTVGDVSQADGPLQLRPETLEHFLRTHADALLVDVREVSEAAAAAGATRLHGRAAQGVPLSRLAEHLGHFLAAPQRPLVFFCRSGNRSAQAARIAQELGHGSVRHLEGGLALLAP
jgi:rhodanese-related sulfurtransferase